MSELMPENRFEINIKVSENDIDELGHVNNIIYLRWVQEAAVAHWKAAATEEQQKNILWVIKRHEIDYKGPALLGDGIIAGTWVGEASELVFERHTEILRSPDRKLLAKARTFWIPINSKTGRPIRVDPDVRNRFSVPGDSLIRE
jgi:acyl-CoA thioester hydrolase